MKRELTAEKPTPIKAPKSPRAQENELGDAIEFMVDQMAQRFRNQVLNQLQVGTIDKFADIKLEVSRERKVVDRYEDKTVHVYEEREFTDAAGDVWTREERVERQESQPIYRTERYTTSTMASGIQQSDVILSFEDAQTGNYTAVLLRLANKFKKKILRQFDDQRLEAVSKQVLSKLDKKSKVEFYNKVAKVVGIDVQALIAKEGLKATTNALMLETAQWIKTLRDEALESFTNNTLFAMSQGESIDTIVSQFDDVVKTRKNHARFLARNQVQNYNSVTTKIRAQNLGIKKAVWETAGDERVRPSHEDREGKEFDLDTGLFSSVDGLYLLPGSDYNCFPGDSKLNHTSLCHKLYRRRYSGELTTLVFDDGVILKTTANHPVLTASGFKAAHLINAGDDVVRCLDQGINTTELYGNRPVPTFEQIYSALNLLGVDHGVSPAISGKFHGDVSDSEVEVISFDSELMREADSTIREKLTELNFSVADQVVILHLLTCNRDAVSMFVGLDLPAHSIMRTLDLCSTLIITHLTPLECFRFALGAWGNALLDQPSSDDVASDAKLFGDCVFAFSVLVHGRDLIVRKIYSLVDPCGRSGWNDAGLIKVTLESGETNPGLFADMSDGNAVAYKLDRVVEKFSTDFAGHIFNLETETGDYIAETTAVSNCRCTYTMIIPEEGEE